LRTSHTTTRQLAPPVASRSLQVTEEDLRDEAVELGGNA
jgi:hypothetical protein